MGALLVIAFNFLSFYILWLFYLAVMNLKKAKDENKLSNIARILGMPILVIGYTLDAFVNLFILTVLLLEIPQELLVTARLSRHVNNEGWRAKIAKWFCSNLLDPFDPSGCHCK